jgi:sugar/nucleoside kinase (ribokinase family)
MKLVPKFLFIGGLRKDYCITPDQRIISGTLGGNAVYSAVGARVWTDSVAILSRIGSDYPKDWLDQLQKAGIATRWVKILSEPQQSITFYAYLSLEKRVDTNPIAHFAKLKKPMPKELLGYTDSTAGQDSRSEYYSLSIRPFDLEEMEVAPESAHLAPAEFLTHSTLPYALKSMGVDIITLDPSERYMTPEFRFDLPKLIRGLDAFIPSEMEARSYFAPNTLGIWEMAERFGEMGSRYVIIKIGARGQILLDTINDIRWEIPAYPAKVRDVTGAGDSYCGGFLVGLAETADPLEAALMGTVSASLTIEGTGALYALGRTPGLAHSRIKALRERVRRI